MKHSTEPAPAEPDVPSRGRPRRTEAMIRARRSMILEAAIKRFSNDGYAVTTMQGIASTAGLSVGLIYDYFLDKEDLLVFAMDDVLDAYAREVPKAISSETDPYRQFLTAVHTFGKVVAEKRNSWLIAYREFNMLSEEKRESVLERDIGTTKLIEDRIKACIKAGEFYPVDSQFLTYQIILLIHGWALSAWRLPNMTCQTYIDRGLVILLNSVRKTVPPAEK